MLVLDVIIKRSNKTLIARDQKIHTGLDILVFIRYSLSIFKSS